MTCPPFFIFFAFALLCTGLCAQNTEIGNKPDPDKKYTLQEYVNLFKDIAVREMDRSGIPASITLAQGIHESGCGNSRLAKEANNHFGIKCHKGWTGGTFYQWDDDPDQSCFRVYDNAEASYIDHTEFLKGRKHYEFLFEYDKTDYVRWAKGLKKAGYATDTKYPDKLIGTIERHQLHVYDLLMAPISIGTVRDSAATATPTHIFVKPEAFRRSLRQKARSFLFPAYKKGLFSQNGCTYAYARKRETPLEFATRFDIPYRKFLIFNDLVDGDQLIDYQACYIQPKKTKFRGKETHEVQNDETMYEIAQYYAVRLDLLLERNLLTEGQEPQNGQFILLNEKAQSPPALRPAGYKDLMPIDSTADLSQPLFPENIKNTPPQPTTIEPPLRLNEPTYPNNVYNPENKINTTVNPDTNYLNIDPNITNPIISEPTTPIVEPTTPIEVPPLSNSEAELPQPPMIELPTNNNPSPTVVEEPPAAYIIHKVAPKESLFSLQRLYGVPWQEIKKFNNLQSDNIRENQELKIPKK